MVRNRMSELLAGEGYINLKALRPVFHLTHQQTAPGFQAHGNRLSHYQTPPLPIQLRLDKATKP